MVRTANEIYHDWLIAHQHELSRYGNGLGDRIVESLDQSSVALKRILREGLEDIGIGSPSATVSQSQALELMIKDLEGVRADAMKDAGALARTELFDFAKGEAALHVKVAGQAVSLKHFKLDTPLAKRVRAVTLDSPVLGRKLSEWFKGLTQADLSRMGAEVRVGFFSGESIDRITQRIVGTKAAGFADGVAQVSRNTARTIARTSVNSYANAVRDEVWLTNADVVEVIQWLATLDGRTTFICASRDGAVATIDGSEVPKEYAEQYPLLDPAGVRPPAHPNCRSVMNTVMSADAVVGDRPFVEDTRTRRQREIDFRAIAREEGRSVKAVRSEWSAARVGQVPEKKPYGEWLKERPTRFQDEYLGSTRGKLFREGGLTVDKFVDTKGRRYTLAELRGRESEAFAAAGL